jgi:hypothetical protein
LLWQIGLPDRWAGEFEGGDTLLKAGETHRNWDNFLRYHELFPHDVNFIIGQSREKDDWFYFHPAALPEDPVARHLRLSAPRNRGVGRGEEQGQLNFITTPVCVPTVVGEVEGGRFQGTSQERSRQAGDGGAFEARDDATPSDTASRARGYSGFFL